MPGHVLIEYLRTHGVPYGGTSAGAAIAAERAIVGGWRARRGARVNAVMYEGASEGLDLLEVRPGLGLTPWSIEVHASQWGTLSRLLHAIDTGLTEEGWAIDENTLLALDAGRISIRGPGQAYHARRLPDETIAVRIVTTGGELALDDREC